MAAGQRHTEAAAAAGCQTGGTVARWISEFNRQGGSDDTLRMALLEVGYAWYGRVLGAGTGRDAR